MYDNKLKYVDKKRYKWVKGELDLLGDLCCFVLLFEFLSICIFFLLCVFLNWCVWCMNLSVKWDVLVIFCLFWLIDWGS